MMDINPMMEKILDLTLEIISLVTGERCAVVKMASVEALLRGLYPSTSVDLRRSQSPNIMPPSYSLTPEKPNEKKILEATNKITELLTGEGGNLGSVSVQAIIKLEDDDDDGGDDVVELGYSEGPKDLYQNAIVDYQPPITSPGGLSTRNPPEKSPRSLYSRNSTQEGLQMPLRDEVYALQRGPLYFQDTTLQENNILQHYQGEHLTGMKAEDREVDEDIYVRDDQSSSEKAEITAAIKEEEISTAFETAHEHNTLVGRLSLPPHCNIVDDDITPYSPMESYVTPGMNRFPDPSDFGETSLSRSKPVTPGARNDETFSCPECHKCFTSKSAMYGHQKVHAVDRSFICSECGRTFKNNVCLRIHQYSHSGKFPFSCPECGKGFPHQSNLVAHIRSHTGERPYSCSECGKCFMKRSRLVIHQRYHTGEKPYSCPECGKGFADAYVFKKHQKLHATVKPYRCLECGKGFILKNDLETHQRRHTGELQYLCSECGKCFVTKSELIRHQAVHTGLKPYSCSQCSKCFFNKSHLVRHEKGHVKEKPYLCFICGRGFSDSLQLAKHQRCHTAERLFSCPQCEKSFINKSSLVRHQLTHTGENLHADAHQIFLHPLEPTQSSSPGAYSAENGS